MYNNIGINSLTNPLNQQQQQYQMMYQQFLQTEEGQKSLEKFNDNFNAWLVKINNMGK